MSAQPGTGKGSRLRTGCVVVALLVVVVFVGVVFAVFVRGNSARRASAASATPEAAPPLAQTAMMETDRSGAAAPAAGAGESASAVPANAEASMPRQELIYTGEMTIEADDVRAAATQVDKIVTEAGGRASGWQMNTGPEGHRTATITLRLPAPKFAAVHDALLKLGEVTSDHVQSEDVTKQFVDLEARLKNSQREEGVIAALFSREGKITDVLQVERELARVRGEIEQIQGELRYLKDQIAFSTLTVTLVPTRPAIERKMESWNLGYHVLRAWRALVAVARTLTYFVLYAVIVVGPFVLLAWIIWRIARALRRRRAPKTGPPPAQES